MIGRNVDVIAIAILLAVMALWSNARRAVDYKLAGLQMREHIIQQRIVLRRAEPNHFLTTVCQRRPSLVLR